MSGAQLTNELSARLVCRVPAWSRIGRQGYLKFAPVGGDAGELIEGAPRTRLWASSALRQDRRTGYIELSIADPTDTYTLDIDGTPVVFDAAAGGAANASDILNGIFDAAEIAAPAGITFGKEQDSEGRTTAVTVESDTSGTYSADGIATDFFFGAFSAAGAGKLAVFGEPQNFRLQLWGTAVRGRSDGPPNSEQWVRLFNTGSDVVGPTGRAGMGSVTTSPSNPDGLLNTAAVSRLAAVIPTFTAFVADDAAVQPAFYVHIGPASDEQITVT